MGNKTIQRALGIKEDALYSVHAINKSKHGYTTHYVVKPRGKVVHCVTEWENGLFSNATSLGALNMTTDQF